jgi:hypothetical protein
MPTSAGRDLTTKCAPSADGEPEPKVVAFNGDAFQSPAQPIRVHTGERLRTYVLNAGPTQWPASTSSARWSTTRSSRGRRAVTARP